MQKLPEIPNRKRRWCRRKRKKTSSWQGGPDYFSLSGSDQRFDNIVAFWCLGTTHMSLDVALVSSFHPVAALSRSALCWNIKGPQRNYKLTLTGLWQNFQKKTNPYGNPEISNWGQIHTWNDLTYFWHLNRGLNRFNVFRKNSLIHGMFVEPSK